MALLIAPSSLVGALPALAMGAVPLGFGPAPAQAPATQAHETAAAPHDPVPLVHEFGLIFVELEDAHGTLLALLDTGANASAIDDERARDLPVLDVVEVSGSTGSLRAETVALEGLRLGSQSLPALTATRRDLSALLAPEGRTVEMILGSDAFVGRALTLDFAKNELELGRGREASPEGVPMSLDLGIPTLPATLAGLDVLLRIDTGASLFATPDVYVNVTTPTWRELRRRDPSLAPTTHFLGTGADGATVELPVAPIRHARIGPLEGPAVFVVVQPEAGYFANPDAKGFVGNNLLEKLGRVTLDYAAGRLRVEPRTADEEAPEPGMSR